MMGTMAGIGLIILKKIQSFSNSFLFRTIIHEFMHGFGRMHLHQRWDRDNYIWIDTSKISQGWESQFTLLSKSQYPDYGVAYDGKSIMSYHGGDVIHSRVSFKYFLSFYLYISQICSHYAFICFQDENTLKTSDIGNANGLRPSDKQTLQIMYSCRKFLLHIEFTL